MKAATHRPLVYAAEDVISIHAAREGGDEYKYYVIGVQYISIHAAREGGDDRQKAPCILGRDFNPRRP